MKCMIYYGYFFIICFWIKLNILCIIWENIWYILNEKNGFCEKEVIEYFELFLIWDIMLYLLILESIFVD